MHRFTLEMSDEAHERVLALVKKSRATSKAEMIRRAMALYELLLDSHASGHDVVLHKEGVEDRLVALLP